METSEVNTATKTHPLFTAYSLYSYHTNSCDVKDEGSKTNDTEEDDTEAFVEKNANSMTKLESSGKENFSVCQVVSSLSAEQDAQLQHFLTKRLMRGAITESVSHITAIDISDEGRESEQAEEQLSTLCYYRMLPRTAPNDPLGMALTSAASQQPSTHFIVCLLASNEALLDLFRHELDMFCENLVQRLDSIDPGASLLEKEAREALCLWYSEVTGYLCQCVDTLGPQIKFLIHASLLEKKVDVICEDKKFMQHIEKFIECCSLSELLNNAGSHAQSSDPSSDLDLLVDISNKDCADATNAGDVKLKVDGQKCSFSCQDCNRFCEDWTNTMLQGDKENPSYLKQIVENFKLKAIQDLNTLKRHLKQAETNHYDLFKCFVFLRSCGNDSVLLRQAQLEQCHHSSPEGASVLQVLCQSLHEEAAQS